MNTQLTPQERVLESIAQAKQTAIANGTYKIRQYQVCALAGVSNKYFRYGTAPSVAAREAYEKAVQELQKFTAKHHAAVMQTIADAQANAIATKTPMPDRKSILREAGVYSGYFNKETAAAQEAVFAYEGAIALVGSAPRPSKAQQQLAAPIVSQPPTKTDQLLGHLKRQEIHLSRLPKLLDVTPEKAEAIAQQLLDEGLVEIKRYPEAIDKKGEFDRLVLKQQAGRKVA